MSMTDQNHTTQGRKRRHKNPASLHAAKHMPLPRLLDHLDTADDPSEEEEKDAKRQGSEPTTPKSISSRPPHEYEEVMGITQMDPRDAERFEEGNDSDFQDAEESATRETSNPGDRSEDARGPGEIHGGFGSATLQECIDRIRQHITAAPATLHSGVGTERSANPPHFS